MTVISAYVGLFIGGNVRRRKMFGYRA